MAGKPDGEKGILKNACAEQNRSWNGSTDGGILNALYAGSNRMSRWGVRRYGDTVPGEKP